MQVVSANHLIPVWYSRANKPFVFLLLLKGHPPSISNLPALLSIVHLSFPRFFPSIPRTLSSLRIAHLCHQSISNSDQPIASLHSTHRSFSRRYQVNLLIKVTAVRRVSRIRTNSGRGWRGHRTSDRDSIVGYGETMRCAVLLSWFGRSPCNVGPAKVKLKSSLLIRNETGVELEKVEMQPQREQR